MGCIRRRRKGGGAKARRRPRATNGGTPVVGPLRVFLFAPESESDFRDTGLESYTTVKALIEDPNGAARELSPQCFLQGSYRQATAIHTINDIDIVVLCELWQPPSGGAGVGRSWSRDDILNTVAAPLFADARYRAKVRYGPQSMCIKVDLGIKVEILPVVYKQGNNDASVEPFRLYRPEAAEWQDGFARYHQRWLTWKNSAGKTGSNFIPMIKVLKHLRSVFAVNAVSFHLESLSGAGSIPSWARIRFTVFRATS